MATESELKLDIDERDRHRISSIGLVRRHAQGRAVRRRLRAVYYDTSDRELPKQGIMLRVRRENGHWVQAVKSATPASNGLHRREEIETIVSGPVPDFPALVSEAGLPQFGTVSLCERIEPAFETDVWRTSWELAFPGGSVIEMALDTGCIREGKRSSPVCEVELELVRGLPQKLYEVALEIARTVPVRIGSKSKAERGYDLLEPRPLAPAKSAAVDTDRAMTIEDGFTAILQNCLAQAQANAAAFSACDDPEVVHQLRVGIRRFRSCLDLFRPVIPKRVTADVRDRLRSLTPALGAARDWDVFLAEYVRPMAASVPAAHPVHDIVTAVQRRHAEAYATLGDLLLSATYHHAVLHLCAWIACRNWRQAMDGEEQQGLQTPLPVFAGRMLGKRHRRIVRRVSDLSAMSADALHELRIDIKRQRYAAEFFEGLYPRKDVRKYRGSLKDLQEILGHLNDVATARRHLEELGEDGDPVAVGFIEGWSAREAALQHSRLPRAWRDLTRRKKYWKT